jgi:dihydrolipoamide dehydrogenase
VIVIGAGPASYGSIIRSSQPGFQAMVVKKEYPGSVCLNVGCIPSKRLLKNVEMADLLRKQSRTFGFSLDNLELDYAAAAKRRRQVSNQLIKGVGFLLKKNKIDHYEEEAGFTSPNTLEVKGEDSGE